uniref:CMP/dCMP-type deaminase domain-containing protein n=1 Tax=Haemonchus contortus TaxID=6289 RepID=A0A7I4Y411_HAECO
MKIVVVIERQKYHPFSAYAPQTGCSEQTKDKFWNLLDEKTAEVPLQEAIVVAAVATQHRPLICTLKIAPPKPKLAERQTLGRWREYFANISKVEFAIPAIPCAPPIHGPVQKITVNEAITALKKTKSGKATGPDDLAAGLWKWKGWNPAGWLTEFFKQVVAEKKVPESWQKSTTIPIWKKKGSLGDCACSRTA